MVAQFRPLHRKADVNNDSSLPALARDLDRSRRRARRLWMKYQATGGQPQPAASADTYQAWSDTVDEALEIAEAMSRQQARNLAEVAMQFEAAWWWIVEDDSVLDAGMRRWLRRFRRSLRRLAAGR